MKFTPAPRVYEDQPLYRAQAGGFTYMISYDKDDGWRASAKQLGATPFDGSRVDLGDEHDNYGAAREACERHARENQQ